MRLGRRACPSAWRLLLLTQQCSSPLTPPAGRCPPASAPAISGSALRWPGRSPSGACAEPAPARQPPLELPVGAPRPAAAPVQQQSWRVARLRCAPFGFGLHCTCSSGTLLFACVHLAPCSAPTAPPAAPPPSAFHFFHSHPWPLCPCRRQFICSASLALLPAPQHLPPTDFTTHPHRKTRKQHYPFPLDPVFRQSKKAKNLLGCTPGSPALLCSHLIHPLLTSAVLLPPTVRAGGAPTAQAAGPPARVRPNRVPRILKRTPPVSRPLAFFASAP